MKDENAAGRRKKSIHHSTQNKHGIFHECFYLYRYRVYRLNCSEKYSRLNLICQEKIARRFIFLSGAFVVFLI